tara:strand:+ start:1111 stop:1824 length:714 start_codon:yes stop_codon:yes gene_type:complete
MAHYSQKKFVEICFENLKSKNDFQKFNVIDVGSNDINGNVKELLSNNQYVGVDLEEGPNVDYVLNGEDLQKIGKKFDIAISCECFEHAKNWDKIFQSMYTVLNDDGILIFTCASKGRIEHGTNRTNPENPMMGNYYKNLNENDFKKKFNMNDMFTKYFFFYNIYSFDLYFIGGKNLSKTYLDLEKIKLETKKIKNEKKELYLKRILYSHLLPDELFQNFRFLRRKVTNTFKNLIFSK